MGEPKFTPGPWEVKPCSSSGLLVNRGDVQQNQIVPEADAHLIAAAPDLYDALQAIVDLGPLPNLGAHGEPPEYVMQDIARAALAKARGES